MAVATRPVSRDGYSSSRPPSLRDQRHRRDVDQVVKRCLSEKPRAGSSYDSSRDGSLGSSRTTPSDVRALMLKYLGTTTLYGGEDDIPRRRRNRASLEDRSHTQAEPDSWSRSVVAPTSISPYEHMSERPSIRPNWSEDLQRLMMRYNYNPAVGQIMNTEESLATILNRYPRNGCPVPMFYHSPRQYPRRSGHYPNTSEGSMSLMAQIMALLQNNDIEFALERIRIQAIIEPDRRHDQTIPLFSSGFQGLPYASPEDYDSDDVTYYADYADGPRMTKSRLGFYNLLDADDLIPHAEGPRFNPRMQTSMLVEDDMTSMTEEQISADRLRVPTFPDTQEDDESMSLIRWRGPDSGESESEFLERWLLASIGRERLRFDESTDKHLRHADRLLAMCRRKKATGYWNPPYGMETFDPLEEDQYTHRHYSRILHEYLMEPIRPRRARYEIIDSEEMAATDEYLYFDTFGEPLFESQSYGEFYMSRSERNSSALALSDTSSNSDREELEARRSLRLMGHIHSDIDEDECPSGQRRHRFQVDESERRRAGSEWEEDDYFNKSSPKDFERWRSLYAATGLNPRSYHPELYSDTDSTWSKVDEDNLKRIPPKDLERWSSRYAASGESPRSYYPEFSSDTDSTWSEWNEENCASSRLASSAAHTRPDEEGHSKRVRFKDGTYYEYEPGTYYDEDGVYFDEDIIECLESAEDDTDYIPPIKKFPTIAEPRRWVGCGFHSDKVIFREDMGYLLWVCPRGALRVQFFYGERDQEFTCFVDPQFGGVTLYHVTSIAHRLMLHGRENAQKSRSSYHCKRSPARHYYENWFRVPSHRGTVILELQAIRGYKTSYRAFKLNYTLVLSTPLGRHFGTYT